MMLELNAMVALLGAGVAAATFFIGRQSAAKATGTEWGLLKSDIAHIKEDVSEVKEALHQHTRRQDADVRRLDKRVDDHLRQHSGPVH